MCVCGGGGVLAACALIRSCSSCIRPAPTDPHTHTPTHTLHQLTFRLCFIYCRATCSVSVCPPAYYAHLLAYRARFHTAGGGAGSSWEGSETGQSARASEEGGATYSEAAITQYSPVKAALSKVMYFM